MSADDVAHRTALLHAVAHVRNFTALGTEGGPRLATRATCSAHPVAHRPIQEGTTPRISAPNGAEQRKASPPSQRRCFMEAPGPLGVVGCTGRKEGSRAAQRPSVAGGLLLVRRDEWRRRRVGSAGASASSPWRMG